MKLDMDLLDALMIDQKKASPLYSPGIYWKELTERSLRAIRANGVSDFRNIGSNIADAYGDNLILDVRVRQRYASFGKRIFYSILNWIPRVSSTIESQKNIAETYLKLYKEARSMYANSSKRIGDLLSKYPTEFDSLRFGCQDSVTIGSRDFSARYLEMLERINVFSSEVDLDLATSFMEIGGGFGSFCHLVLELFPGIKTYYYVDVAPNIYTATEYLKSFYGDLVLDYLSIKTMDSLPTNRSSSRTIYCLPAWEISKIPNSAVDVFHNANSFVEMPEWAAQNYASSVAKILQPKGKIILHSYDAFDLNTTWHPQKMCDLFKGRKFKTISNPRIFNAKRSDYFFISQE